MAQQVPVFTVVVANPYPSYTKCVEAADYNTQNQHVQRFLAALLGGGIAAAVVAALGPDFWCYALATEVGAIAGGLAYCNWWLNDRLVCLPMDVTQSTGPPVDVCAVGMFVKDDQLEPTPIPFAVGNLDTDWTMDIVLYDTQPGQPDDILITEQMAVTSLVSETQGFNLDSKLDFEVKTDTYTLQPYSAPGPPRLRRLQALFCIVKWRVREYTNSRTGSRPCFGSP